MPQSPDPVKFETSGLVPRVLAGQALTASFVRTTLLGPNRRPFPAVGNSPTQAAMSAAMLRCMTFCIL
jgi:hypothetical protein